MSEANDLAKPPEETIEGELVQAQNSVPVTRTRWLTLTSDAPLQVVHFANYLRFGPNGVRHFGPHTEEGHLSHPHTLKVHLKIKQVDKVLLEYPNFVMHHSQPNQPFNLDGTNIWYGQNKEAHVRVLWVWDFYRLFGGLKIAVEVPPRQTEKRWETTVEKMRNVRPGDQIIANVDSRSGNILQVYPIDTPAFEQEF